MYSQVVSIYILCLKIFICKLILAYLYGGCTDLTAAVCKIPYTFVVLYNMSTHCLNVVLVRTCFGMHGDIYHTSISHPCDELLICGGQARSSLEYSSCIPDTVACSYASSCEYLQTNIITSGVYKCLKCQVKYMYRLKYKGNNGKMCFNITIM